MRVDVVAVGTELLLGQIVDTNSSWIGEQLAAHGFDSLLQTKVGDNLDRVVTAFRRALAEADAVIVCGGLGPTHDDLTRQAIAAVMGVDLALDDEIADRIRELFAARGRPMPENNLTQAMVPAGASVIPQTRGTAPGLICPVTLDGAAKVLYAVPGVPHEMKDMLERAVLPDLHARSGEAAVIVSRTLRTWGDSESGLAERLAPLIDELDRVGNPTLAFLASGWEGIKVRLTAKAADSATAADLLSQWSTRVEDLVAGNLFGYDDDTMESVVLDRLRDRGLTLGLAESATGGLLAARLTAVAGADDVLRGSIVSHETGLRQRLLGAGATVGVEDEQTAGAMAVGARRALDSSVGLAVTGGSVPADQTGAAVSAVCIGLALGDAVVTTRLLLPGQHDQIRQRSVIGALDFLRRQLLRP
ncbi:CinA family nicotinamide mononucleotide deamidase-related protein [Nakamurella leprariae]|uniref:CinA-like protein n=1 Tax=Nakamurella leprariae TaxID=2803911 RepID=A0A938YHH7_9ACTN|nr:CinA family nicotinamide mononucleotide deamidase-related protein [Nakamurella leprariae]MBM9469581.1 CinA family nicotinamide mononucleotide deamidase-related protein [Nakamurella leprariae]